MVMITFHITLKHLLSISFLYFSGITHELTVKVKIGIIKALMISTLPNFERFRFDHIEIYFITLKASWVSRLADSKFSNWKLIPLKYLNVFGNMAYF
jgi:hypothetical protein